MADFFDEMSDDIIAFINEQHIFFTATAPQSGRINLSPKGMNTFRCLDCKTAAYLDLTGSGNETSAHLTENGRMTIMFCSLGRRPLILRLYGRGTVVHRGDTDWDDIYSQFDDIVGARQIIKLSIDSLQTSCGFAVPEYEIKGTRHTIEKWAERKVETGIEKYWQENNLVSIDGLPARPFTE